MFIKFYPLFLKSNLKPNKLLFFFSEKILLTEAVAKTPNIPRKPLILTNVNSLEKYQLLYIIFLVLYLCLGLVLSLPLLETS